MATWLLSHSAWLNTVNSFGVNCGHWSWLCLLIIRLCLLIICDGLTNKTVLVDRAFIQLCSYWNEWKVMEFALEKCVRCVCVFMMLLVRWGEKWPTNWFTLESVWSPELRLIDFSIWSQDRPATSDAECSAYKDTLVLHTRDNFSYLIKVLLTGQLSYSGNITFSKILWQCSTSGQVPESGWATGEPAVNKHPHSTHQSWDKQW